MLCESDEGYGGQLDQEVFYEMAKVSGMYQFNKLMIRQLKFNKVFTKNHYSRNFVKIKKMFQQ